jgi:uncharacterized membrane protein
MWLIIILFAIAAAIGLTPPTGAALALSFLGSAVVLAGGFCGGTLVYRFGVGVSERRAAQKGKHPAPSTPVS